MVEPKGDVLTGLDVLAEENFAPLRGKRIGLITNHTGFSRDGKRNVDLMLAAGVKITALFSPGARPGRHRRPRECRRYQRSSHRASGLQPV